MNKGKSQRLQVKTEEIYTQDIPLKLKSERGTLRKQVLHEVLLRYEKEWSAHYIENP